MTASPRTTTSGDVRLMLLDIAFLAAESYSHEGEIRSLAFGINGHHALVIFGAGFQFDGVAAVVAIALQVAGCVRIVVVEIHAVVVVPAATAALQHVAVFLQLVLVVSD